jgi:hypothetical protein
VKTLDARMKKRPKPGKGGSSMRGAKRTDALQISEPPSPPEAEPELPEERPELVVVTYRLRPEHVGWIAEHALRRKIERGAKGRADASAVLRELLDRTMALSGATAGAPTLSSR